MIQSTFTKYKTFPPLQKITLSIMEILVQSEQF